MGQLNVFLKSYWIIVFAIAVGAVFFAARVKQYMEEREAYFKAVESNKFRCYDFSKWIKISYGAFAIFGLVSAIVDYKNTTTIALGIVLCFLFAGEFLLANFRYRFYYNTNVFFCNGKLVRYKSVKEIVRKRKIKMAFVTVRTFNAEEFTVSPKVLSIIEENMKKAK